MQKLVLILFILLNFSSSFGQDSLYTSSKKGKIFISWGGNRESYSKSDIRFQGSNYDFTVEDATAYDRPKGWHIDYINPARMTIPQTNFKLGYFITDNYAISIGVDHMKYVMDRNQTRRINGYIDLPVTEQGAAFNGTYNGSEFLVSEDMLKFEHTDGLNYVNTEFSRHDDLSYLFGITNTDKFQININEGIGLGLLYPKTNTTLLYKQQQDDFHWSGFGASVRVGLNFTFFKHFFIATDLKGGFINMNDIRTTKNTNEKASQKFFFLQRIISFGGIFKL
ncbi:hypothetical protein [Aurantibacter sp.]|uniref:hypothetical protein n=1 Tax=Aurantibacter sp. TaxID=2807103 RepID=UPI0035C7EC98